MGIYLRVVGANLDVDTLVSRTRLEVVRVWRRGEWDRYYKRVCENSGFNAPVGVDTWTWRTQLEAAAEYLDTYDEAVSEICRDPGIEHVFLDFSINMRADVEIQRTLCPPKLLRRLAEFPLALEISTYPFDEEGVPPEDCDEKRASVGHLGLQLLLTGPEFAVDDFLAESGYSADSTWNHEEGDGHCGCSILIGERLADLDAHMSAARELLQDEGQRLRELRTRHKARRMTLDFGLLWPPDAAIYGVCFGEDLVLLAARESCWLCLSMCYMELDV